MTDDPVELPPEIAEKVMSFLREVDGDFEVADMQGLVAFIAQNGDDYPALYELIKVNGDAVIQHFEETGEVLPGVKLIGTSREPGSNVTHLTVLHGPIPPNKK